MKYARFLSFMATFSLTSLIASTAYVSFVPDEPGLTGGSFQYINPETYTLYQQHITSFLKKDNSLYHQASTLAFKDFFKHHHQAIAALNKGSELSLQDGGANTIKNHQRYIQEMTEVRAKKVYKLSPGLPTSQQYLFSKSSPKLLLKELFPSLVSSIDRLETEALWSYFVQHLEFPDPCLPLEGEGPSQRYAQHLTSLIKLFDERLKEDAVCFEMLWGLFITFNNKALEKDRTLKTDSFDKKEGYLLSSLTKGKHRKTALQINTASAFETLKCLMEGQESYLEDAASLLLEAPFGLLGRVLGSLEQGKFHSWESDRSVLVKARQQAKSNQADFSATLIQGLYTFLGRVINKKALELIHASVTDSMFYESESQLKDDRAQMKFFYERLITPPEGNPLAVSLQAAASLPGMDIISLPTLGIYNLDSRVLEKLDFSFLRVGEAEVKILSEGNWAKLISLSLRKSKIGDRGAQILSRGSWPSLERLGLNYNEITEAGVQSLSRGSWPALIHLELDSNPIGEAGAHSLSQGSWPSLKYLTLDNNYIGDVGVQSLSRGKWPALEHLGLNYNEITEAGAQSLSQGSWPALKHLKLNSNKIGKAGAHSLSQGSWPSLESLELNANKIGNAGVQSLSCVSWPSLKHLELNVNKIGDAGIQSLNEGSWRSLEHLELGLNKIGDVGVQSLSRGSWLSLKRLNLSRNQIGDTGVQSLNEGRWPSLEHLELNFNEISDEGVQALIFENWPALKKLNLIYNSMGEWKDFNNKEWKNVNNSMI